ncbi:phospholipid carrier-dependent glycosyltransferase [Roseburia inulinivorans]
MRFWKKVIRENEYGALMQLCLCMVIIVIVLWGMNYMGLLVWISSIVSVMLIGAGSVLLIWHLGRMNLTADQVMIVFTGYLIRVAVMLIDIFASDYITIMHSGSDALGFWKASGELYTTGTTEIDSSYAQLLSGFYHVIGQNRVLAQYINILFFAGTVFVVLYTCRKFCVEKKYVTGVLLFLCFLPNYIVISSILLRESSMIFFDVFSFYLFLCWMENSRTEYMLAAFLAATPAIILHSGAMGMWAGFLFAGLFWNAKKQKKGVTWITICLLIAVIVGVTVIELVPSLRDLLMVYFPSELTIESITGRYFVPGGSDYLMNLEVHTWGGVAFWTIIRMIYFALSPMPMDWRGIGDAAAFCIDSVPTMILLGGILKEYRHSEQKFKVLTGLVACLAVCAIFAWGTSNAGTAMRHRSIIVGVYAMTYCISKGKKHEEHL